MCRGVVDVSVLHALDGGYLDAERLCFCSCANQRINAFLRVYQHDDRDPERWIDVNELH